MYMEALKNIGFKEEITYREFKMIESNNSVTWCPIEKIEIWLLLSSCLN